MHVRWRLDHIQLQVQRGRRAVTPPLPHATPRTNILERYMHTHTHTAPAGRPAGITLPIRNTLTSHT